MGSDEPGRTDPVGSGKIPPRLGAAVLHCENCQTDTSHRILKLDHGTMAGSPRVRGTARCRICQWIHPFEQVELPPVRVAQIISEGGTSRKTQVALPRFRRITVGSLVPHATEKLRIHRIDTRSGERKTSAVSEEIATLWVTRYVGAVVPVSVIEGARTTPYRLEASPERSFEVGQRIVVDGASVVIVALRARGATWRRPRDAFVAREVQRIYGRRIESPPAGKRAWRTGRGTPSSFDSSISRSPRSRSSPGVRSARTSPSAPTAEGGATVQRSSPS